MALLWHFLLGVCRDRCRWRRRGRRSTQPYVCRNAISRGERNRGPRLEGFCEGGEVASAPCNLCEAGLREISSVVADRYCLMLLCVFWIYNGRTIKQATQPLRLLFLQHCLPCQQVAYALRVVCTGGQRGPDDRSVSIKPNKVNKQKMLTSTACKHTYNKHTHLAPEPYPLLFLLLASASVSIGGSCA